MDAYGRKRARLVEKVRTQGVTDPRVLRAVGTVPRHRFVPEAVRRRAYEDTALPIGFSQTISQPSIQALYLQVLEISAGDRVLEIGTGSGYQTALLAELAANVYSVERIQELAVRSREVLDELGYTNVAILTGDGTVGWSRYAPYDAILVAAAAPHVPQALVDQLAPDGRMLIPLGDREVQTLTLVRRTADGGTKEKPVTGCVFVPLIGRFGWPD
ncbi:MAG TPA: protein-L-isoaspartate(D-aspartate) O-methyltransferase [Longimicrobiales bacterium]|nr:protein-L-isoaspartate(D-aspartate) O-methyltransferase [Longimicrobiales bacterium]